MEGWGIRRDEGIMWCLCGPSQSRPAMQQSAGRGREISQNKPRDNRPEGNRFESEDNINIKKGWDNYLKT